MSTLIVRENDVIWFPLDLRCSKSAPRVMILSGPGFQQKSSSPVNRSSPGAVLPPSGVRQRRALALLRGTGTLCAASLIFPDPFGSVLTQLCDTRLAGDFG